MPTGLDDHLRGRVGHLPLDPALGRQLELGLRRANTSGASSPSSTSAAPGVGDVLGERSRPSTVGSAPPDDQDLAGRDAQQRAVPGRLEAIAHLARCEHGDDGRLFDPQLSHASAPRRRRRRASARRKPSRRAPCRVDRGTPPSAARTHPRPIDAPSVGDRSADVIAPDHRVAEQERLAAELGDAIGTTGELEADQAPRWRQRLHALERPFAHEPRLRHVHRPRHAELRRRVVGHRVLSEVDVALLEAQELERIEAVRARVPRSPRIEDRAQRSGPRRRG